MLGARVVNIPGITVTDPISGITANIPILCHTAGCYWIYQEAFNSAPNGDSFAGGTFSNPTGFMTAMARFGKKMSSSTAVQIVAGTVLIFTLPGGAAEHTCIIRADGQIGGFNQTGWFPGGFSAAFSTHPRTDIPWRNGRNSKVTLSQGRKGNLMAVDENTAVNFMKFNFGKTF